ncbi:MAG: terpene cyclase/mutase family protein [Chloroflexi bacterium]|nr:terpene cyclase/mutase family protein [Chloroflexota bacterium]
MNTATIVDSLKQAILVMVKRTRDDIERLNANNISLTLTAMLEYNQGRPSRVVDDLYQTLITKQLSNGSWMDELWATALALWAIHTYAQKQGKPFSFRSPVVRKALNYIKATKCEQRSNWQGELYETIILAWVFLQSGHEPELAFAKKAVARLKEIQTDDGYLFDIYDTAMALCTFHAAQDVLVMDNSSSIQRGVRWLKEWEPRPETPWNRAWMLFLIAYIGLDEANWAGSVVNSILEEIDQGVISDDHDEQAMSILALSSYLNRWFDHEFEMARVPIDGLLNIADYGRYLQSCRERLNRLIESLNALPAPKRVFKDTGKSKVDWSNIFSSVDNENQFNTAVESFYRVFYEGSGYGKRLPEVLLGYDSALFKISLFKISQLRLPVAHDIEHGKDPDIEKKDKLIETVYRQCCGKNRPHDVRDYRLVHVFLLNEVEEFLHNLYRHLTGSDIAH